MPELPEVEIVVRTLRPSVVGARILHTALRRRDILRPGRFNFPKFLTGNTIQSIQRRGKKILFTLQTQRQFYIHLGMSGRLTLESVGAPILPHTHLILRLSPEANGPQIRFRDPRRFGGIWVVPPNADFAADLGPEPLSLRPHQLAPLLASTKRPIKSALLDQRLIAGLGNIYVDESLFSARIHPLTPANALSASQCAILAQSIKRTLEKAIRHRGSTLRDYRDANGKPGKFAALHNVYARTDKPCSTCQTPIQRITITGRSTHFCPRCQQQLPLPGPKAPTI